MSEDKKPRKKDEGGDPFWSRILIFAIVVVWLSLMVGNWIGHYIIQSGVFARKAEVGGSEFRDLPAQKPKPWKKPVKIIEPTDAPEKEFEKTELIDDETPEPTPSPGSETAEETAEPTPSPSPSPPPEPEPSPSPTPRPSPRPSPSPSPRPSPSPSPKPTLKPEPSPSPLVPKEPEVTPDETIVEEPAETGGSSDAGSFTLQAGNFTNEGHANELVDRLKGNGYSAQLIKMGDSYKVYVGSFDSKDNAREMSEQLQGEGFDNFVVAE